jgi:hypothetical protein
MKMLQLRYHLPYTLGLSALALTLTIGTAWPAAAATSRAMTTAEVRAQFAECGYEIGNPGSPESSPYIVLVDPGARQVRDTDYRIVMAIVYRDLEAATTAHARAHHLAEQRLSQLYAFSNDNGPQLLSGYGGSVWRANVALVESNSRTLNSMYSYDVEADETRDARPELNELGFVTTSGSQYAVDRDFVSCLDDAPTVPSDDPYFLQGHPW